MNKALLVALAAGAMGFGATVISAQAPASTSASAARGETLFKQRCAVCHAVAPGGRSTGPNLLGVFGRQAASGNYNYSPALKKSGLVWNAATLERYLAAPVKTVPGTRMAVSVANPADRKEIIAFLQARR